VTEITDTATHVNDTISGTKPATPDSSITDSDAGFAILIFFGVIAVFIIRWLYNSKKKRRLI